MTIKQLRRTAISKTPPILGLMACSAFLIMLTGCITLKLTVDRDGVSIGAGLNANELNKRTVDDQAQ